MGEKFRIKVGPLSRTIELDRDPVLIARKVLLEYGPAPVGLGLWAFARLGERVHFTAEAFRRVFGALAAFYDDWTNVGGYGEALEEALESLDGVPESILDLATGTGYVARRLKKKFAGAEVVGVDIAPEMVAIAQHQSVTEGLDVKFQVADIADLPFDDSSFDLVTVQNAFPYPEELMRVIAPGGRALFVFSFAGPWVALAWGEVEKNLRREGAGRVIARRAGMGFFAIVHKQDG